MLHASYVSSIGSKIKKKVPSIKNGTFALTE